MAAYDDLFPTRTGGSIGAGGERKMLDQAGGAQGIRTRLRTNPDGSTTRLKTRAGNPEFLTSPVATEESDPEPFVAWATPVSEHFTLSFDAARASGGWQTATARNCWPTGKIGAKFVYRPGPRFALASVKYADLPTPPGNMTWYDTTETKRWAVLSWNALYGGRGATGPYPVRSTDDMLDLSFHAANRSYSSAGNQSLGTYSDNWYGVTQDVSIMAGGYLFGTPSNGHVSSNLEADEVVAQPFKYDQANPKDILTPLWINGEKLGWEDSILSAALYKEGGATLVRYLRITDVEVGFNGHGAPWPSAVDYVSLYCVTATLAGTVIDERLVTQGTNKITWIHQAPVFNASASKALGIVKTDANERCIVEVDFAMATLAFVKDGKNVGADSTTVVLSCDYIGDTPSYIDKTTTVTDATTYTYTSCSVSASDWSYASVERSTRITAAVFRHDGRVIDTYEKTLTTTRNYAGSGYDHSVPGTSDAQNNHTCAETTTETGADAWALHADARRGIVICHKAAYDAATSIDWSYGWVKDSVGERQTAPTSTTRTTHNRVTQSVEIAGARFPLYVAPLWENTSSNSTPYANNFLTGTPPTDCADWQDASYRGVLGFSYLPAKLYSFQASISQDGGIILSSACFGRHAGPVGIAAGSSFAYYASGAWKRADASPHKSFVYAGEARFFVQPFVLNWKKLRKVVT